MSNAAIFNAFAALVNTFAANATPALTVGYDDVNFTPPESGHWLEVRFFPNETDTYSIDDSGLTLLRGFVQVCACNRPSLGIAAGLELAEAIVNTFPRGSEIGGSTVEKKAYQSSVLQEPAKVSHPVTIEYRAASTNESPYALFLYGGAPDQIDSRASALAIFGGGP